MQVADKEGVEEEAECLFVAVITTGHLCLSQWSNSFNLNTVVCNSAKVELTWQPTTALEFGAFASVPHPGWQHA